MKKQLDWTKKFTEQQISLNKQFYWMIIQWEKERNNMENEQRFWEQTISFFYYLKKWMKWVVH